MDSGSGGGAAGSSGPAGLRLLFWLAVAILAHVLVALFGVLNRWLQVCPVEFGPLLSSCSCRLVCAPH